MQLKQLIAILLACMLTGCSTLVMNTDELLHPPSLSSEQAEVMQELKNALGTDKVNLKYPRYGDYRSAFVFHDINGDDQEDALVFYQDANGYTRINTMCKIDGKWQSVYDLSGLESDIEFIDFAPLMNDTQDNIIIGWNSTNNYDENTINIYNFEDNKLKKLYDDYYSMYKIVSRRNMDNKELVILTSPKKQASVRLIKGRTNNKMSAIGVSYLNSGIVEYENVTLGILEDNIPALFIDERLQDGRIATEVISLANSQLDNKMVSNGQTNKLFESTTRHQEIFSSDIDNDSIIEIPCQQLLPGYGDDNKENVDFQYITNYSAITGRDIVTKKSAYVNIKDGYEIFFPDSWINNVTVKIQPQTGELSFVVYNTNLEKSTTELLRVRVYSKNDYRDKFELEQYKQIASKGLFDYYAYIPPIQNTPLSIDYSQLSAIFAFI